MLKQTNSTYSCNRKCTDHRKHTKNIYLFELKSLLTRGDIPNRINSSTLNINSRKTSKITHQCILSLIRIAMVLLNQISQRLVYLSIDPLFSSQQFGFHISKRFPKQYNFSSSLKLLSYSQGSSAWCIAACSISFTQSLGSCKYYFLWLKMSAKYVYFYLQFQSIHRFVYPYCLILLALRSILAFNSQIYSCYISLWII